MTVTPNAFVSTQAVKPASAVTTAAKTTYNDNANAVKIATAHVTNGSVLYALKALPRATVTATQLQIYRSPDNGVTMYFINSALMGAYTMAQITAVPVSDMGYTEAAPLRMAAGDTIWVAQGVALAAGIAWDAQVEDL